MCETRIAGVVQLKKKQGEGPRIERIVQTGGGGVGAAIFVYIVLRNSQQSPNGEPKVSHVYAKHQLFLFELIGCAGEKGFCKRQIF